jgi:hypothetical protein
LCPQAPAISAEDLQQPDAGAKRALLEAVLQLSMPDEVSLSADLYLCFFDQTYVQPAGFKARDDVGCFCLEDAVIMRC